MCAYAFFGADHVLFGTDMPYDSEGGDRKIEETIKSLEQMDVSEADKEKIFAENARSFLYLLDKGQVK
jgi:predicted TIM-barrel fold metal-dependent hydrolase